LSAADHPAQENDQAVTSKVGDASSVPGTLAVATAELEAQFGDRLLERGDFRSELTYSVGPEDWLEVLRFCKEAPALDFDQLDSLLGDHLPERSLAPLQVVAHLLSHTHGHRLRVKTALAEGQELPSVTGLWPSAGFDEREAWEMYGIVFAGHPNLERLLTTEDFEGHPMRKDFPLQGTVGGRIRVDLRGKI
jgi:NADH-quinone oxidoreductase subunit C